MPEFTRTVRVASAHGLHARPARLLTQAVKSSGRRVTITAEGKAAVDGASILALLSLNITEGTDVTITVDAVDTASGTTLLDELAALTTTNLDD